MTPVNPASETIPPTPESPAAHLDPTAQHMPIMHGDTLKSKTNPPAPQHDGKQPKGPMINFSPAAKSHIDGHTIIDIKTSVYQQLRSNFKQDLADLIKNEVATAVTKKHYWYKQYLL